MGDSTSILDQSQTDVSLAGVSAYNTSALVAAKNVTSEIGLASAFGALSDWFLQRIGTGGGLTVHMNFRIQPGTGSIPTIRRVETPMSREPLPSTDEMLATAMANLTLTVTDVSRLVGVERPTVYAWLRDEAEPLDRNHDRIVRLFWLARRWHSEAGAPLRDWTRQRHVSKRSVLQQLNEWVNGTTDSIPALVRAHPLREQPAFSAYDKAKARGLRSDEESRERIDRITGKRRDVEADVGPAE